MNRRNQGEFVWDCYWYVEAFHAAIAQKLADKTLVMIGNTNEGIQFNDARGEIVLDGDRQALRPKTFALAQALFQAAPDVLDKSTLLQTVWGESMVEEQAIFQSINEIRKAFGDKEVIRTYPRRGYAWVFESQHKLQPGISADEFPRTVQQRNRFGNVRWLISLVAVAVLFMLWIVISPSNNSAIKHDALLVLPMNTQKLDEQQRWFRFGGMEQIIQQVNSSADLTTFQMSDVLAIMHRIDTAEDDPRRYFGVSGATHIVASELVGVPGDYQLLYTIHKRDGQEHGVISGQVLADMTSQLSHIIAQQLHTKNTQAKPINSFHNQLVFNAVQLLAAGDVESSISFLQSATHTDPNAIQPLLLLASVYQQLGKVDQSQMAAQAGFELAIAQQNEAAKGRFQYLTGVNLLSTDVNAAKRALSESLLTLEQANDWLYVAYAKSMLGHALTMQQQYDLAEPLFLQALQFQQVLKCPLGIVQGHIDLSDFYLASHQLANAEAHFRQAQNLIESAQLEQAKDLLENRSLQFQ